MKNKQQLPATRLTKLLGIEKPIIQAGMVYVSGAKLAAAAANSGCLGVVGAGSMSPDLLASQLTKLKSLTANPIAVNLPLLYSRVEEQIDLALQHGVRIFITSAGSPARFTPKLKAANATVMHVASHPLLALKCQDAGVDAVVIEGVEAGGHNGREELTTLVLLQQCRGLLSIPLVAAGGIGSGAAIAAALALGADGVQIGTLFAASAESSAHDNFKREMVAAQWSQTMLQLKTLVPVRLLRNQFAEKVREMEQRCASKDELAELLGKGRAKQGMLNGDMDEGELEIGQIVSQIDSILPMSAIVEGLCADYAQSVTRLNELRNFSI